MINASEFSKLYAKTYGVSREYGTTVCRSVFDLLSKVLYEDGQDVSIYRFGVFNHKTLAEKKLRHPVTGETIKMPMRDVVKFRQSELFDTKPRESKGDGDE